MKVLELVPKLNEVIIEIVIEMSSAKNPYGQPMYAFSVEAILNSMSRFTRLLFPKANTADRRKVSITVGIEGQSNDYLVGDMVSCKANIERIKFVKDSHSSDDFGYLVLRQEPLSHRNLNRTMMKRESPSKRLCRKQEQTRSKSSSLMGTENSQRALRKKSMSPAREAINTV